MTSKDQADQARLTLPGLRWMLLVACVLVFLVGILLFILTEQTDRYFAWAINPPLMAAFLGAAYWSAGVVEFAASRQRLWERARLALPAVLIFTLLTLIVTLIHLDRFHLAADLPLITRLSAWIWLGVYVVVPIILGVLLIRQMQMVDGDSPRISPLPGWLRVSLSIQGVIMLILGMIYLVMPQAALTWWPWELTALTGRALGAWLCGLAVALLHAIWENDWERIRVAAPGYVIFPILEFIALARYPSNVQWNEPGAWLYIGFLASMLLVSIFSWITRSGNPR